MLCELLRLFTNCFSFCLPTRKVELQAQRYKETPGLGNQNQLPAIMTVCVAPSWRTKTRDTVMNQKREQALSV